MKHSEIQAKAPIFGLGRAKYRLRSICREIKRHRNAINNHRRTLRTMANNGHIV